MREKKKKAVGGRHGIVHLNWRNGQLFPPTVKALMLSKFGAS
jgi:hypothetical protein